MLSPHVPLHVSSKFQGKSERGLYGDVIMEIDWSVGQILEALKQQGLDRQTLVIFTSDNGPWLVYGDHVCCRTITRRSAASSMSAPSPGLVSAGATPPRPNVMS